MEKYITVAKAVELTGKSISTITRFCRKNIGNNFVKNEKGKFFIHIDFLKKEYVIKNHTNGDDQSNGQYDHVDGSGSFVDQPILISKGYERLQIEFMQGQINELTELLKANTLIINSLQENLSIRQGTGVTSEVAQQPLPVVKKHMTRSNVLKKIKELRVNGLSYSAIANALNDLGIRNYYNSIFTTNAVGKICRKHLFTHTD